MSRVVVALLKLVIAAVLIVLVFRTPGPALAWFQEHWLLTLLPPVLVIAAIVFFGRRRQR